VTSDLPAIRYEPGHGSLTDTESVMVSRGEPECVTWLTRDEVLMVIHVSTEFPEVALVLSSRIGLCTVLVGDVRLERLERIP
jgi:hypothetical protein